MNRPCAARPRRPNRLPRAVGALLAAALAACAPSAAAPDADDALSLFRAAALAPGVEIHAAQDLLATAEAAARRLAGESGRPVEVLPIGTRGDGRRLRVLFGRTDEPAIQRVLEQLDVEVDAEGFELLGRRFEGEDDALALTAPDPERPGLPLRVVAANGVAELRAAGALLEPGWRSRFEVWRAGRPVCAGRLEGGRPVRAVLEVDRGELWADFRARSRAINAGTLRVVGVFDGGLPVPVRAYLTRAQDARRRALEWAGIDVGEVSGQVVVHESTGAMLARFGRVDLARRAPIGGDVHVLVDGDGLDDGGRVAAETAALQVLGAPAEPWLVDALGVWASGRWYGRELDAWVARLHQGTLALSAAELTGRAPLPPLSEHRLVPQQAFLFEHLLEARGPAFVRGLWDGSVTLEVDETLETEFHAALEANREAEEARSAPRRAATRRRARELPRLRGVHLIPPAARDGLLGRLGVEALVELHGLGANAISLPVEAWFEGGRLRSDRSDLELILFARRAGEAGFTPMLLPGLLSSESGDRLASVKHEGVEAWESMFERYAAFAAHYALVAELGRVPLLSIGDDLGTAVDTRATEVEGIHRDDELGQRLRRQLDPTARAAAVLEAEGLRLESVFRDVRRAGWGEVIARARAVYDGQLTYVAARPVERGKFDKWGQLDLLSSSLFLPYESDEERELGPARERVGPTLEQVRGRLVAKLVKLAQDAALVRRPGLVVGLGVPAAGDAWSEPRRRAGPVDPEVARVHGEALAEALAVAYQRHPDLAGTFLWCWHVDPARRLERPRGFDLRNGRDAGLLRRMLGGR